MFKLKNDLLPTSIGGYFDTSSSRNIAHNYNLRDRSSLSSGTLAGPRLLSGKKSIQYRGEILWNEISDDVKESKSICSLKRKLKKILLCD